MFINNIHDNKINLLDHTDNLRPKGKKIFQVSKFIIYLFSVLTITFFIFTYQVLFTQNSFVDSFGGKISIFKQLTNLAWGNDEDLAGIKEDRINVLLLGIGGAGHDGPNLTDTIILASIQPSTKKIAFISIPRDLLVNIPEQGMWKINNANHFGELKKKGNGGELASQVVANILDLPIHYYVRVDFTGFEKLIDDLGGIKIFVEKDFVDYQYPTNDYKYQVISFEKGWQTMDGDTALKYVRSRHGNNGEGSDFARSERQQKVIMAIKDRALSYSTLFNPKKLNKLLAAMDDHVKTNMEISEALAFYTLIKDIDLENAKSLVLDDSPNGYLYSGSVNGAYVLQPKGGDFSQIQFSLKNIFFSPAIETVTQPLNLEIMNGTPENGLAFRSSEILKKYGYKILKIGNAPEQNLSQTIIYDLTAQKNQTELEKLSKLFPADIVTDVPEWVKTDAELTTDYYIILGQSAIPFINQSI